MNKIIEIDRLGNIEIGYLSYYEGGIDIPFDIKRLYYIYQVPSGVNRGGHAHKELMQAIWCPHGSVKISLDNGFDKKTYILDSPQKILIVGPGVWRDLMWLVGNSVICVAASEHYDESEYIRDYNEFLKYSKKGFWGNGNKL